MGNTILPDNKTRLFIILIIFTLLAACGQTTDPTGANTSAATQEALAEYTAIPTDILPAETTVPTDNNPTAQNPVMCIDTVDDQPFNPNVVETIETTIREAIQNHPNFTFISERYGGNTLEVIQECPSTPTILSDEWTGPEVGSGAPHIVNVEPDVSIDDWLHKRSAQYFIFVGPEDVLQQAFGDFFPRRTPQEMLCMGHQCAEVTSAIYLTSADIADSERLQSSLLNVLGLEY
ncbi:MAG: hypothetical protein GFH27_549331n88 [Chloroflexi bacterium AL-W]|nr:hypothetical protein [Chloroflexi bacterium AL-N1]NOK70388.1 hypothetical protein [Chloroflexi bacterium AL-N10]NOK78066.1 hypothetical protein [Chloroflexi bacterium AL-N5]NOK85165.1 hypothetical protein [Chloroflexi bacterium AL-W]NOK92154.1 hypothetical protein [Chloroflexi bacterium AL-N15]